MSDSHLSVEVVQGNFLLRRNERDRTTKNVGVNNVRNGTSD